MGNNINIKSIPQTLIPIGRGHALSIVVGKSLQSLTFNRGQFADSFAHHEVILCHRGERPTLLIFSGFNAPFVRNARVRICSVSVYKSPSNITPNLIQTRLCPKTTAKC